MAPNGAETQKQQKGPIMADIDTSADAAEKLADWFGDRCTEYDPECSTCRAWEAFDALSRELEAMRARAEQAEADRDKVFDQTNALEVAAHRKGYNQGKAAADMAMASLGDLLEKVEAERDASRARVAELTPWAALGVKVMRGWPDYGDIDGFSLQDYAVEAGVLRAVDGGFNPKLHTDTVGVGAQAGDDWFTIIDVPAALSQEGRE